jgi:hypothetical protein
MTHDTSIHTDADLDTAAEVWAWTCHTCGAGETGLTAGAADDAAAGHVWEVS